jgi:glycosyltransferase involved in cell wall biosynthesis
VKLLCVAGGFTPPGGIEFFIGDLAPALTSRRHAVSLLCWGPRNPVLAEIARSGVDVQRQLFRWGCRLSLPDLLLLARWGAAKVESHDAIMFTKIPPAWLLAHLRRAGLIDRRRPFIYVTAYRPSEMWGLVPPSPKMLNLFDCIVIQAPGFAAELRNYGYGGSIVTIPLIPPKSTKPRPLPAGDRLRLGFLGRLVPQKNLIYLLEVFGRLVSGVAQSCLRSKLWELHIYGDGPMRAEIHAAAAAKGLEHLLHFHGAIPHGSVPDAIDHCHLFAFSSVSEGQCLAALEILARGRPIVATPVGAFPEFLNTTMLGELAPLQDAAGFARALEVVSSRLVEGRSTPDAIQSEFEKRFPRAAIIDSYCDLLTGVLPDALPADIGLNASGLAKVRLESIG